MGKVVAVIDPSIGLFAVVNLKYKPPYDQILGDLPYIDYDPKQMKEYLFEIMVEQAAKLGFSIDSDISYVDFCEINFKTSVEAKKRGIRIYCLGNPELMKGLPTSVSGTSAEMYIRLVFDHDGFRTIHYHKKSSSEQGFDVVVKQEETGTLGIVEVKAHNRRGGLKTYLPFVKSVGSREMSIPWILYNCDKLENKPDLAKEIRLQIERQELERFVIVIRDDRTISNFINEDFYDDKIDDYLVGGEYRIDLKNEVREMTVDVNIICRIAQDIWESGIPQQSKKKFDEIRRFMSRLNNK